MSKNSTTKYNYYNSSSEDSYDGQSEKFGIHYDLEKIGIENPTFSIEQIVKRYMELYPENQIEIRLIKEYLQEETQKEIERKQKDTELEKIRSLMECIGIECQYDAHYHFDWSYVLSAKQLYDVFTDEKKFNELISKVRNRAFA